MKGSRKNISRGSIRRRRQLRDQRRRAACREERRYARSAFSLRRFVGRYKAEAFFIAVLIAGVLAVASLGPDKKAAKAARDSVSSFLTDRSREWNQAYPYGYKIIALTDKDIIHTSFDTLPGDLEIDWKNLSVSRIQADRLRGTDEKIKIGIDGLNYAPAGVSGVSVTAAFSRKKGARAALARFGGLDFAAEIVEDDGEYLFLLLGLRGRQEF